MSVKDSVVFTVDGENHEIVLDKLTSDSVTLVINSDPIEVTLKMGDSKKVDVDGDGILDLLVELRSIDVPHQKADIYFEDITVKQESAPVEEVEAEETESEAEETEEVEEIEEEEPETLTTPTAAAVEEVPPALPEEKPSKLWIWVSIAVIIVVVGIGYFFVRKKKSDNIL